MNLAYSVPAGADRMDVLVRPFRDAFDKLKGNREQWVEGTLELAALVLEARAYCPAQDDFSRWLAQHDLRKITRDDRTALLWFRANPVEARELLQRQTRSVSWDAIYRKYRRNKSKGSNLPRTGHRRRAAVIPTCMREDYEPGSVSPASERPLPILKGLTREQVDPDFVGTPQEFAAKYGLVNLQTKQEIEYHKRQEELMAWLALVSDHARSAHALLAAAVDSATLRDWLTKPGKAAKLQGWHNAIEGACELLMDLKEKEVER